MLEQSRGFLETPSGPLAVVEFLPRRPPRGSVLFVPAFGEEMNYCRRVVAEAGRRLARRGFHAVAPDLSGTGESPGTLEGITVNHWINDIAAVHGSLTEQPYPISALIGIRFGALLAAAAMDASIFEGVALIMWQPMENAVEQLDELAAQRVIAARLRGDADTSTAVEILDRLFRGEDTELGGYRIGSQLANSMRDLTLPAAAARPSNWHEITIHRALPAEDRPPSAVNAPTAVLLGHNGTVAQVAAAPFWSLPECPMPNQVFDATEAILPV